MTSEIPHEFEDIFVVLQGGYFLTENHPDLDKRRLYEQADARWDEICYHAEKFGYELVREEGYIYIASFPGGRNEQQSDERLKAAYDIIDLVSLFENAFSNFFIGGEWSPADLEQRLQRDDVLRKEAEAIPAIAAETLLQSCEKAFKQLEKFGSLALSDRRNSRYKLVGAHDYTMKFLMGIQFVLEGDDDG